MARLRSGDVQPGISVFFWSDDYANAHSSSCNTASQRCATYSVRSITATRRSACESDASFWPQTHDIDKRRWGGQRAQGPITTYTRPYSTYSSLLYLSSTGLTPRLHIEDGIACFGATGRSSSCTECDPTYKNPAPSARKA